MKCHGVHIPGKFMSPPTVPPHPPLLTLEVILMQIFRIRIFSSFMKYSHITQSRNKTTF